ncbi:MAG: metallophosphoesterase [Cereibacter sphaeroides]|uniref:Metallophosphoesterase n=1 Tax=Cereibacter sphaeroides TaxID=1063 RepID=A0A2W5S3G9_CERSP|nr:MAG: metallophosphoesterase [Cereibacter sphaeroides]
MIPPVAVIADAHFHDITGDFGFSGIEAGGRRLTLRSWAETATAGRAFNESGDALRYVLQQVRAQGVRHVVLLGDYTDDGQAENTRRLADYLGSQRDLRFYAIPGNHDVYGPSGKHTATRFLSADGRPVLVTSDPVLAATEPDAILTSAMRCDGQPEGLMPMAAFGLSRQPEYIHWETPFGASDRPDHRLYVAHSADGQVTRQLMDASYLVEPEDGLWLLMIDANIFEPRDGSWRIGQKRAIIDPAAAGWNALPRVKPFLLEWIADVRARADRCGKQLLTFSHYPALDPFQDGNGSEQALFGETVIARRSPRPEAAQALAATGVRLHVSGHIHAANDATIGTLREIALPSITGFPPAFAVLRSDEGDVSAKMIPIAEMPLDPGLMGVYRAEAAESDASLSETTFGPFLTAQMRARVLSRVVPRDWPSNIMAALPRCSALDLAALLVGGLTLDAQPDTDRVAKSVSPHGLTVDALANYALTDLVADWYLLRQAGALTEDAVSPDRIAICRYLVAEFADGKADPAIGAREFFARFLSVLAVSLQRLDDSQFRPAWR